MSKTGTRVPLAVAGGALVVLATEPFSIPVAAWLAFGPLLWALHGVGALVAAGLGALAGFVLFAGVGYGLGGYHLGLAAALPLVGACIFALYGLAVQRALDDRRIWLRVLGPPVVWAALECGFSAPPLLLPTALGVALAGSPALPLASVGGVHGLSFLMVLSGAALAEAWRGPGVRLSGRALRTAAALAPAGLALLCGALLGGDSGARGPTVAYRAVQPGIPFERAAESWWVPAYRQAIRGRFAAAVRAAQGSRARLFLWPEGSAMLGELATANGRAWLSSLGADGRAHLVSSIDLAPDGRRRNRVLAFDGPGPPAIYEKRWLVPIAERGYQRGEAQPVFEVAQGRVGPLVCFEVCFPGPARAQVARGAQLLFASTNDGAFGASALTLLHRSAARLRAAENARPVLFVSNDGPSAEIDARGRIVRELPLRASAALEGRVRLSGATTPYRRLGPLLPPFAWGAALLLLAAARRGERPHVELPRRAWIPGLALALVAAAGLAGASAALVRRNALPRTESDALALEPSQAIRSAVRAQAADSPVAALAYLTSHLGEPRDASQLRALVAAAGRESAVLPALRDAALALGYRARLEERSYPAHLDLAAPFIAPLAGARFLVVLEARSAGVSAFDPSRGFVHLSRERFTRLWSGAVVVIRPGSEQGPRMRASEAVWADSEPKGERG